MPTLKEIQTLINRAQQSLPMKLTNDQFSNAQAYLQEQAENDYNLSPALIAQVALYGVIVAGGFQPVVQINWGNPRFATDFNSQFGGRGHTAIDNDNQIDFTYGDPLGVEMDQIETILSNAQFGPNFLQYLQNNRYIKAPQPDNQAGSDQNEEKKRKTPGLTIKPPTSIDP